MGVVIRVSLAKLSQQCVSNAQNWASNFFLSQLKCEKKKGKIHSVQASASGIDECQNNDEFGIYSLRLLTKTCPIDIVTGKLLK